MAESWVFDRGTFPVLRWTCSRRVTTYVVQLFGDRSFATAGVTLHSLPRVITAGGEFVHALQSIPPVCRSLPPP